ncbi:hypothetical protein [Porphyrobacter sp. YT40]|uniref:hypothetical protein n=1 Tax=Porphyrobacter sp. YT40 TaxID=2547601 RepID=UPI001143FB0A|nr:hypothetical protein [Porphyrobacter sp. YT40]QDH35862.1 hypothetical protein E2E27_16975 [Porphyrobacter sp. YT40]
MHRIDTSGNVDNRFHPGNPATGQQATLIDQDWLNAVQEEIVNVILQANIDLEKGTNDQLAAAIVALIAGVVGDGSGAVPTTRLVSVSGGLLTGGGNLAADRTIGLTAATTGETADQIRNDVVVTPASLAGLISWSTVGGAIIASIGPGKIVAFTATAGGNGSTVITLPVTFSAPCRAVCSGGIADNNAQDNPPYISSTGTNVVTVYNAIDVNVPINIIAMGVA